MGINPAKLTHTIHDVLLGNATIQEITVPIAGYKNLFLAPSIIDLASAESAFAGELGREQLLAEHLADAAPAYDWILIACPPSLTLLTINALTAATWYLLPIETESLAVRGAIQLMDTVHRVKRRTNPALKMLGVLPTQYDARTVLANDVLALLRRSYPGMVFAPVPQPVKFKEAVLAGKPMIDYAPDHPGAQAYRDMAEEVLRRATQTCATH